MIENPIQRCSLAAVGIAMVLLALVPASYAGADDYGALHRLGQTDGEEYVAQRDALLRSHPEPRDIEGACGYSWEAGLAAYVLNARLLDSDSFARWDAEVERNSRAARLPTPGRGLDSIGVSLAFRMEFGWKPPPWIPASKWSAEVIGATGDRSPNDFARKEALTPVARWALCPGGPAADAARTVALPPVAAWSLCPGGPPALWRVLCEDCDIPEFRAVAVHNLACSDAAEDQQVISTVLFDGDRTLEVRRAALIGYITRQPPGTVETLIKLAVDREAPEELSATAASCLGDTPLGRQDDPRAHSALRELASNPQIREQVRCAALDACALAPRPEDIEITRAALGQSELPDLQRAAFRAANAVRDPRLCPALEAVLHDFASIDTVSAVTSAILRLCGENGADLVRAYVNDPAVPEEARQRASMQLHRFEQFKRVDAQLGLERS